MRTKVFLEVEVDDLDGLRESLCLARFLMNASGVVTDQKSVPYISRLIEEIDNRRSKGVHEV